MDIQLVGKLTSQYFLSYVFTSQREVFLCLWLAECIYMREKGAIDKD